MKMFDTAPSALVNRSSGISIGTIASCCRRSAGIAGRRATGPDLVLPVRSTSVGTLLPYAWLKDFDA
jgi:hypothetical protein